MEVLLKHSSVPLNSEIAFCVYIARIVFIPRYTLRFVLSEERILPGYFAIALQFTLQSDAGRGFEGPDPVEYPVLPGGFLDRIDTGAAQRLVCPGADSSV
jgi:hypothetical protein